MIRGRRWVRLAFVGNATLLAVVLTVSALAAHAAHITRAEGGPAAVYLLYDDNNPPGVPRWVFALGLYRMSLAAQERWGPGCVIVAPLSKANLTQAFRHGHLVVLACHGSKGRIQAHRLLIAPACVLLDKPSARPVLCAAIPVEGEKGSWVADKVAVGANLHFVYNSACDAGLRAADWEQALAPVEVRTFPRISAVGEHILWLWFDGPRRVREIP